MFSSVMKHSSLLLGISRDSLISITHSYTHPFSLKRLQKNIFSNPFRNTLIEFYTFFVIIKSENKEISTLQ